jgi:hypothetical protein
MNIAPVGPPNATVVPPNATLIDTAIRDRTIVQFDFDGKYYNGTIARKRGHLFFILIGTQLDILLRDEELQRLYLTTRKLDDEFKPQQIAYQINVTTPEPRVPWSFSRVIEKIRQLASDAFRGGPRYDTTQTSFVTNYVEMKTRQADFIAILLLGGLNPRVFNILHAPAQRLTTEEFFQKVHEKLADDVRGMSIREYIFEQELTTRQSMAEPRIAVNPAAASFTEQQSIVDSSLRAYMQECHARGRNLYIICLSHFLRGVAPQSRGAPEPQKVRAFVNYMASLYTQHAVNNNRSLSSDYYPASVLKRQRTVAVNTIEKRVLLDRALGVVDSYRINSFSQFEVPKR